MDHRIQLVNIPNKGRGFIAKQKIPKGTIIIKEYPSYMISEEESIFSDMFQLLYHIINCGDETLKN